jgi:pilus assembly protein Flp/PilA
LSSLATRLAIGRRPPKNLIKVISIEPAEPRKCGLTARALNFHLEQSNNVLIV